MCVCVLFIRVHSQMHWKVSKEKTVGWTDGHHDSLQMSIASSLRAISWAVATLPPWKVPWLILVRDWIREIPFKKPLKPGSYGNLLVLVIAVTEAPSDARWLCDVCRFTWPVGHPAVNDHVHPGFVEVTFPRVAHQSKVTGGKYCSCAQILQLCKYVNMQLRKFKTPKMHKFTAPKMKRFRGRPSWEPNGHRRTGLHCFGRCSNWDIPLRRNGRRRHWYHPAARPKP